VISLEVYTGSERPPGGRIKIAETVQIVGEVRGGRKGEFFVFVGIIAGFQEV